MQYCNRSAERKQTSAVMFAEVVCLIARINMQFARLNDWLNACRAAHVALFSLIEGSDYQLGWSGATTMRQPKSRTDRIILLMQSYGAEFISTLLEWAESEVHEMEKVIGNFARLSTHFQSLYARQRLADMLDWCFIGRKKRGLSLILQDNFF